MPNPAAPTLNLVALREELRGTPYEPLAPLGQGGMGEVFEVEHRTLRRKLVMKLLREPNRPDLEDRLRLEAQSLAHLSHRNLLHVVDFSKTAAGRPFIVSERLYGRTLKECVGLTGALPVHEAVTYACHGLAGLAVAHRAGIVHRDVKLDNLFLCDPEDGSEPHVKVIDFGIAKLVNAEREASAHRLDPLAVPTAEGLMVGTPTFMSPEQVTSQPVDHRADLYGMGVVLYRLVAGRNPFICRDLIEYAAAHASEIPSPPSRFAPIPPALDAIILRALEKQPGLRFASAKEMIDALTPFTKPLEVAPEVSAEVSPEVSAEVPRPNAPLTAVTTSPTSDSTPTLASPLALPHGVSPEVPPAPPPAPPQASSEVASEGASAAAMSVDVGTHTPTPGTERMQPSPPRGVPGKGTQRMLASPLGLPAAPPASPPAAPSPARGARGTMMMAMPTPPPDAHAAQAAHLASTEHDSTAIADPRRVGAGAQRQQAPVALSRKAREVRGIEVAAFVVAALSAAAILWFVLILAGVLD